jgi:hypothetical protein
MESLSLPTTAAQANVFISPTSLSYPMSSEVMSTHVGEGMNNAAAAAATAVNGSGAGSVAILEQKENVTTGGVSGIVPTLQ